MKGIIRVGSIEFAGRIFLYWSLFVLKWLIKKVKNKVGSTAIISFPIFYNLHGGNHNGSFRVDYILISCPELFWNKLKKEFKGRYICLEPILRGHKRSNSMCRTDVDFWKESELSDELSNSEVLIASHNGKSGNVLFEIMYDGNEPNEKLFYKPYSNFTVDVWGENYEKNSDLGTLLLQAETKYWKEYGRKRRKSWKLENGNYKEGY